MDQGGAAARGRARDADAFASLPDEVLLHILVQSAAPSAKDEGRLVFRLFPVLPGYSNVKMLCRLRTVCRRFNTLVPGAEQVLWYSHDQNDGPKLVTFLEERKTVKELGFNLSFSYRAESTVVLQDALAGAPLLQRVTLRGVVSRDTSDIVWAFFGALSGCPQLHTLALHSCHLSRQAAPLTGTSLRNSLTKINVVYGSVDGPGLQTITRVCHNLESLTLEEVSCLSASIRIQSKSLQTLAVVINMEDDPQLELLEIEAPNLVFLSASCIDKLSINAPRLATLVLGMGVPEVIVKKGNWRLATLELTKMPYDLDERLQVVHRCGDAKVVKIGDSIFDYEKSNFKHKEMPALFFRSFKGIEELSLPFDLLELLDLQEGGASKTVAPLKNLRRLELSFVYTTDPFDLCCLLLAPFQKLECLILDFTTAVRGLNLEVGGLFKKVLRLQKAYPVLDIVVRWPSGPRNLG